jgi:predicted O-linked N-acetylglucosamine transferase (SPINDLY family)
MSTIAEAFQLAIHHHQSGDLQRAESIYRQILQADPQHADAMHFLGVIAHQVGKPDIAIDYITRSLTLAPLNDTYHCNLAAAYQSMQRFDDAIRCYREAMRLQPNSVNAHNGLGNILNDLGRFDEAVASYRRALQLDPNCAEAHSNIGVALQNLRKPEEAESHCRKAVRLKPNYPEARNNLGNSQGALGKLDEAILNYREALRLNPNFALAHNNLGGTLHMKGKLDEAVACYREALRCLPNYPEAHSNLATALQAQGKLDEAEDHLRESLRLRPTSTEAMNNLGGVLQLEGKLTEAAACFRDVLRLAPDDSSAHSNLLLCWNYDPHISPATLLAEHQEWGKRFGQVADAGPAPGHDRNPSRRLRVGYVSPDLSWHPIAHFLTPILTNHDPHQVEAICYADVTALDTMTTRLRSLARGWRSIHGQTDSQVASLIRNDRIDILIDLAGHTSKSRLHVFAFKPAPVQVTYLGYPNTTGLPAIDYCLTDDVADPPGEPSYFTEELIRLPRGFSCYTAPASPEIGPLPALQKGYVTFASLHNLPKLNAGVFDLWSAILRQVPTAHLLVFRHTLQGKVSDTILRQFLERGIEPARIELRNSLETGSSYLDVYRLVDISLDTFPWSGHTTTCESLWMGVPMVTMRASCHAGRMVASVLTEAGLTPWIADNPQQYVEIASRLAQDINGLAAIRSQLREQVKNSALCDGKGFTQSLEAAYRAMWQRWCTQS